jgi:hypothetical protein
MMTAKSSSRALSVDQFKSKVREYTGASDAWDKMVTNGVEPKELRDWLWVIAELERVRRHKSKLKLRNVKIGGVPLHELDRYPDRLRDWAVKLLFLATGLARHPAAMLAAEMFRREKRMISFPFRAKLAARSGRPLLSRRRLLRLSDSYDALDALPFEKTLMSKAFTDKGPKALEGFRLLPVYLALYASYLDVVLSIFRAQRNVESTAFGGLREVFVLWVRKKSGHVTYGQIATLLDAAYWAIGFENRRYLLDAHTLQENQRRSTLVKSLKNEDDPAAAAEEILALALRALPRLQRRQDSTQFRHEDIFSWWDITSGVGKLAGGDIAELLNRIPLRSTQ